MSLLSILQTVWNAIARIFKKLPDEVKQALTLAQQVMQNVKNYVDNPGVDVLTALIPGDADNKIVALAREILADLLLAMTYLTGAVSTFPSRNDALKEAVARIKSNTDDAKDILYHGMAAKLSVKLSDGKLPWSEATAQMEYLHRETKIVAINDAAQVAKLTGPDLSEQVA